MLPFDTEDGDNLGDLRLLKGPASGTGDGGDNLGDLMLLKGPPSGTGDNSGDLVRQKGPSSGNGDGGDNLGDLSHLKGPSSSSVDGGGSLGDQSRLKGPSSGSGDDGDNLGDLLILKGPSSGGGDGGDNSGDLLHMKGPLSGSGDGGDNLGDQSHLKRPSSGSGDGGDNLGNLSHLKGPLSGSGDGGDNLGDQSHLKGPSSGSGDGDDNLGDPLHQKGPSSGSDNRGNISDKVPEDGYGNGIGQALLTEAIPPSTADGHGYDDNRELNGGSVYGSDKLLPTGRPVDDDDVTGKVAERTLLPGPSAGNGDPGNIAEAGDRDRHVQTVPLSVGSTPPGGSGGIGGGEKNSGAEPLASAPSAETDERGKVADKVRAGCHDNDAETTLVNGRHRGIEQVAAEVCYAAS